MEDFEKSAILCFHGIEYTVTISVEDNEYLVIEIEDERAIDTSVPVCWSEKFNSSYIEEITKKTGNFKRFSVFVNMLLSAISQKSDSVFIDLLTYADLAMYHSRKLAQQHKTSTLLNSKINGGIHSKRYLILTYTVEFDRIHYPLPLNHIENPSTDILKRTIRRLRKKLIEFEKNEIEKNNLKDNPIHIDEDENKNQNHIIIEELQEENQLLQEKIHNLKLSCNSTNFTKEKEIIQSLKQELQATKEENNQLAIMYQTLRSETSQEISILQNEMNNLKRKNIISSNAQKWENKYKILEKQFQNEKNENIKEKKLVQSQHELEIQKYIKKEKELIIKNKELMRQISLIEKNNLENKISKNINNKNEYYMTRPAQSTTNYSINKQDLNYLNRKINRFTRFDPTAYHKERQEKVLRARSQSPSMLYKSKPIISKGLKSVLPRRKTRNYHSVFSDDENENIKIKNNNDYTSDSGYSSNGSSNGSITRKNKTKKLKNPISYQKNTITKNEIVNKTQDMTTLRRSRSRSRSVTGISATRQRELDKRLSSPKITSPRIQEKAKITNRKYTPSPSRRTDGVYRSVSPFIREKKLNSIEKKIKKIDSTQPAELLKEKKTTNSNAWNKYNMNISDLKKKKSEIDSFSDIDSRLNALQNFLREAKNGKMY